MPFHTAQAFFNFCAKAIAVPARLEERVDEWRERRTLGQNNDHRSDQDNANNGKQPPALIAREEEKQFARDAEPLPCGAEKAHTVSSFIAKLRLKLIPPETAARTLLP